jgi:ribonucleoside-diphosphate reductase alpha chain
MIKYDYKDVYDSTLKYFKGDELATNVWITKYAKSELLEDGTTVYYEKTPDDMFHRIASEIARAGEKYNNPLSENEVYELIKDYKYILFAGRPMAGIGVDDAVSISNCFVVGRPGQDSYGTIATIDQEIMQLSKRGGGVGTDLSSYRPGGSKVHNAARTSSGPVEICATRFSNTIREVGQNGRRGALMLSMDITHPSAEEFMDAKMEDGKITGANISMKLYDDWMKSALGIDCEMDKEKNRLWKKIIHNATTKAEPGVLFWDTILRESPADCYSDYGFKTISTNPCGEIPLAAGDACRLMSLNLYSYVDYPFTSDARFNFDKFINHAKLSIKLMDNMIDLENEKIDRILAKIDADPEDDDIKAVEKNLWSRVKRMNNFGRRSGIGFTALGDMLAALGLKYGTPEATHFVEYVQKVMATAVYIGSCDLVQIDGRPAFGCFNYELEKNNLFLNRLTMPSEFLMEYNPANDYANILAAEFEKKWTNNLGRRNIALLTCAPAGSLSTQSQTTSGLEPVFMISYRRRRKIDKNSGIKPDFIDKTGDAFIEFNVVHHKFIEWYCRYADLAFWDGKHVLEHASEEELKEIIKKSPYYKATAMDCDWHERINMQAALQKYVDHSLSVTCNLPKGTTEEVVEDVYRTAWESGCKGCTIYVDGSRDGVLINKDEKKKCECNEFIETNTPKRPKKLPCKIVKFSNRGEKWVAAVGLYEGRPYEIFTGLAEKLNIPNGVDSGFIIRNKIPTEVFNDETGQLETVKVSRYDIEYIQSGETKTIQGLSTIFNEEFWNYGKLISGLLRHGMPVKYVVKSISSLDFKNDGINSWKSGVIRALKSFMKDEDLHEPCPQCGGHLRRESGCIQCTDCGWSKCGAN